MLFQVTAKGAVTCFVLEHDDFARILSEFEIADEGSNSIENDSEKLDSPTTTSTMLHPEVHSAPHSFTPFDFLNRCRLGSKEY
jgi:hypothetical protein